MAVEDGGAVRGLEERGRGRSLEREVADERSALDRTGPTFL